MFKSTSSTGGCFRRNLFMPSSQSTMNSALTMAGVVQTLPKRWSSDI